jgi:hypothetical protein
VLPVETWAEARRLHRAEGLSQRAIARRLGIAAHVLGNAEENILGVVAGQSVDLQLPGAPCSGTCHLA